MTGAIARFRRWWTRATPAGYQPGALLSRLRHDLGGMEYEAQGESRARFHTADGLEFLVQERAEPHFLMHVVTAEFIFRVPHSAPGERRLQFRHRGAWKRTGIECIPEDARPAPADERLAAEPTLAEAMLPLDFTHCELTQDAHGWQCRLTHFGASEVVYRMPPLRRYVRLSAGQRDALLATFRALLRAPALRSNAADGNVRGTGG